MTRGRRLAVLLAYVAVFWVALPLALWKLARWVDGAAGWTMAPRPILGGVVVASGLALVVAAMVHLRAEGRGLPVSALPPSRLAQRGPYGLTRHPIYLGFDVGVVGAGVVLGSPALATVVAALFTACWLAYARLEEVALLRRFGERYRAYRRRVGVLPRLDVYLAGWALLLSRAIPVRVLGRARIPRRGPAVLVANHAAYPDFLYVSAAAMPRRLCCTVTAEAYRSRLSRWVLSRVLTVPVRRYRVDPLACREILRALEAGHLVYVAPEGERATLGRRSPPAAEIARVLSRLPCPVIPVGISGSYDVGPRWAGTLRRRAVTVRVGAPVVFGGRDPVRAIDDALRPLVDEDPQRVHLSGLPRSTLQRVLWRCPSCLAEEGWDPAALACAGCGARWHPTDDGRFVGEGRPVTLAELATPVWSAEERAPLRAEVTAWRERTMYGRIEPLQPLGRGELTLTQDALRFADLTLPLSRLRTVSTERNDTLQVATADAMWQFRVVAGSCFRLQNAVERWRLRSGGRRVAG